MKIELNLPSDTDLTLACLADAIARIIADYSDDKCTAFVCSLFDSLGRVHGKDAEFMVKTLAHTFPIVYNMSDEELALFTDSFSGGSELEDDEDY